MPDDLPIVDTDTGLPLVDLDTGFPLVGGECPLYELLLCPDSTPLDTPLGLRNEDNTDSAVEGDTVKYPDDSSTCYILGCKKCDLTPTSSPASKTTGCSDPVCTDQLYSLTDCCGGPAPAIGLRPIDLPVGASIGSTVANPANGKCLIVGELVDPSGLTPTTTMWFSVVGGCGSDDCPPCPKILQPCCCPNTVKGLRAEDSPVGLAVGNVVNYMGVCYTVADPAGYDTPTTEMVTVVGGCDDDSCDGCVCGCRDCDLSGPDGVPYGLAGTYALHVPAGTVTEDCVPLPDGTSFQRIVTWIATDLVLIWAGLGGDGTCCFWISDRSMVVNVTRNFYASHDCTGDIVSTDTETIDNVAAFLSWCGCDFGLLLNGSDVHNIPLGTRTTTAKTQDPRGTYTDGGNSGVVS